MQKRRKKKNKCDSSSDSSGTDFEALKIPYPDDGILYNQHFGIDENQLKAPIQQVHELQLTDDLADSLVNPPIDHEITNEDLIPQYSRTSPIDPQNESLKDEPYEIDQFWENVQKIQSEDNYLTNELELVEEDISMNKDTINEVSLNVTVSVLNNEDDTSKKIVTECVQNVTEIVGVLKESLNLLEEQKACTESVSIVENSKNVEKQMKIGNQSRKNKNSKKAPKTNQNPNNEISKSKDDLSIVKESKMSYSSVTKSNIVKESKPLLHIQNQPKVNSATIIKPLSTNSTFAIVQDKLEDDSDKWEKNSNSVSKVENWEKTANKRKNKNRNIKVQKSVLSIKEQAKENTPPKEVIVEETAPDDENETSETTENEKKKQRRKKKKQSSEDPEENIGHRIIICDEQVNIIFMF